jgi:energy-coupling factor transporter ATP-binding protein EcfA2
LAVVEIQDLHYAYPPLAAEGDPIPVLLGVELAVERGEFLALMGRTGAGKTTLCQTLNGLVPQSTGGTIRGRVTVLGLDARRTPVPELAARVGLVFQDAESQLFNMTVEDEVAFGPESLGLDPHEIAARVDWALAVVRMGEHRRRSPFHLSGGQKQRVAIASILAMRPEVLILDEPTSSLDPAGRREVLAVVQQLRQDERMTVILVEQEPEPVAELADRVAVLSGGRIVLHDAPRHVFAQADLLWEAGLAAPQVSQLAHALNARQGTRYAFTTPGEAYAALSAALS